MNYILFSEEGFSLEAVYVLQSPNKRISNSWSPAS